MNHRPSLEGIRREDPWAAPRHRMVQDQIGRRGLHDARLLAAFEEVPRHRFVPAHSEGAAYDDTPLAIGWGQTISQPYIVALMTSLLDLHGDERVLEIGTGSGYQAAILSKLAAVVHTVEIIPDLALSAAQLLADLHCDNVCVHQGDGSLGWPEAAPYAAIVVTAASPHVPEPLPAQLQEGGRLVVPVEHRDGYQMLTLLSRQGSKITDQMVASVCFVPLRGAYGWRRSK